MDDLTGTADERRQRLSELAAEAELEAEWLQRQLALVLEEWARAESELRVAAERREDY
ncbi:hypothetical protein [Leifsonia aquatica]|uniref:Toxin-antitoxin system, antitoxin component, ribbon-helix-helix domain protein n=2 Tax=Leifsonia aquatica TaxID=144185 RepID=U2T990_LEIAQ|nr:hypothetical protein [Leifsonia aquatica]ERK71267.1 hypothetical protein N136_02403 [Leifsonia aquatica ATCC 14665]MBB2968040.1 hypothetical protein [Leifsonia aquatica]